MHKSPLAHQSANVACHLSSYLAFKIPATRRDVAIGGAAAAVASAFPIPASAGLMFDPIGAYSMGGSSGATNLKPVKADPLRPNSGITLLREVFDGYLPDGGLLKCYEQHLADDFQAVFEGGKVKLDKQASASQPLSLYTRLLLICLPVPEHRRTSP